MLLLKTTQDKALRAQKHADCKQGWNWKRAQLAFFDAYGKIKSFVLVNRKFADTKPKGMKKRRGFRKPKSGVLLCKAYKSSNNKKNAGILLGENERFTEKQKQFCADG